MTLDLQQLRDRGFADEAAAIENGLHVPSNILKALKNGDYETAHYIRIRMVAQDCAECILDGVWENWQYNDATSGPWTWAVDEQRDAYLDGSLDAPDTGDFFQSLSEADQDYFDREVDEKVAVLTAEALAEDPYLRGEDDAPDPSVVAEVLSAIPQYRELVSTNERRERITAAAEKAAQVMPQPVGPDGP